MLVVVLVILCKELREWRENEQKHNLIYKNLSDFISNVTVKGDTFQRNRNTKSHLEGNNARPQEVTNS